MEGRAIGPARYEWPGATPAALGRARGMVLDIGPIHMEHRLEPAPQMLMVVLSHRAHPSRERGITNARLLPA